MEYLQRLRDRTLPAPPMGSLIDAEFAAVEPGRVVMRATPGEQHLNPLGTVHGGFVCTLLDTVAGCAAHSVLEAGVGYTSIELKVSYLRAVAPDGRPVTATGTVTKAGSRVVFVDAVAVDAEGRTVATASSSLLVLR
ncbi:PaaI family thioesterase [Schumannella soli]|uniref:PaaI family thioesterase n=2 Tax=Schumannella soli TaxID=2590779 RepID=A0A506Y6J9_9MICO|nr:PaaI family thioesterase [Schumannella soli]